MNEETKLVMIGMLAVVGVMFAVGLLVAMILAHPPAASPPGEDAADLALRQRPYHIEMDILKIGVAQFNNVIDFYVRHKMFCMVFRQHVEFIPLDAVYKINVVPMDVYNAAAGRKFLHDTKNDSTLGFYSE